jgi:hypothetical protein
MAKKVSVVIREKQNDGLRMAVGLTLDDLSVTVFVMGRLDQSENVRMNVESLGEMRASIVTNDPENAFVQMSTEEIARALVEYDAVITY